MHTIYDLVTMAIFAGLVILFLQRSAAPEDANDRMYYYLPPALGCAVANWLGNQHQDVAAIAMILGVIAYSLYVLKPFSQRL